MKQSKAFGGSYPYQDDEFREGMRDYTETLKIGSRAPEFALVSANHEQLTQTLSGFLRRGALVLEFLRGTW